LPNQTQRIMTYSQDDLLDSDLIPHHVIAEIDKHGEGEITEVYRYDERGNIDWRNNLAAETSENHSAWFEAILESWHPSDAEVEKADWERG
jgi:hypothetical protein